VNNAHYGPHYGPQIRKITNLFRKTNLQIMFHSANTIYSIFRPVSTRTDNEHTRCGIHKLTCSMRKHTYVGQTGRNLRQRYLEHIRYIKNDDPQSAYAVHILNNRHEYGDINSMSLVNYVKKGPSMNTSEQFYIQLYALNNKLVHEQYPGEYNLLFQLLNNFLLHHNHVT
jgi:hypothetical protein